MKKSIDPRVGQEAEGKRLPFLDETHINTDEIKTFVFDSPSQKIHIETDEFSAVCPFSGLPDIAKVVINYVPKAGKALELKALKYYFLSFRSVGIYQEGVTKRIHRDLCKALSCKTVEVTTVYNTRGGLDVTCIEGKV